MAHRSPNAAGKRFPESARIERLGVSLCHRIVTEMGHIWREKGVDYGVDGEIELIDVGLVLNRVLWVQSKASTVRFPREDATTFRYTCSQADLNYWLSGTAPVLLVCSHPDTGEAWFKHLPSWFADPVRRRERHVDFDKVADRFDAQAARTLLELGAPKTSGIYLSPPPRREKLTSNLLEVEHLAQRVHIAPTRCRSWADANPRLQRQGNHFIADVVFRDGNAYSFRRFDEPPLDAVVDGPVESIGTDELADSEDEKDQQLLRWLLNATLKDLTSRDLRLHNDGFLFFKAREGEAIKRVRMSRGKGRAVVQRYEPAEGATWYPYTRHYALDFRFQYAAGRWYLALTPTYHFTSDGRQDFPFAAQQLATIKRFDGHDAVRGQTVFWAKYLAGNRNLFSGEPDPRLRFGQLMSMEVERGIDDKSWKPSALDEPDDEDNSVREAPTLFDIAEGA